MKKGIVLLELIFAIALFSIISLYSLNIILELYKKNESSSFQSVNLLKLESTRLFLINNNDFSKLVLNKNTLNYKGDLLLDNVSEFELDINGDIVSIDICIYENRVCQKWKISSSN